MASNLASMALTAAESKALSPEVAETEGPRYPYGLCLYLDETVLAKLGMKEMPAAGTIIPLDAVAKVVGWSEREYEGGKHRSLELQITDLGVEPPEEEETSLGSKVYGKKMAQSGKGSYSG